jgi:transcriptional regulator with XRE-family HTH domain
MRPRNYTVHKMDDEAVVLNILTSARGRTAVASGSHGTVVRLVRQALGLHQSHVATRSGYSQATISRIEQNHLRDPVVLMDLADALSIPRGIFGGRPDNDSLTGPSLEDMERREMLKAALAVASAAMLPTAVSDPSPGRKIGLAVVNECWTALDRLQNLEATQGGGVVYELTAGMATRLRSTLSGASYTAAVGRSLRQVTAATMIQAGWQAYDARQREAARRWWLETLHLSDLGDGIEQWRMSALASLSREAADSADRGHDVIGLAQSAAKITGASPAMLSLLAAREAMGHAALGNDAASASALTRAQRLLDRGRAENEPQWLRFWGPGDLAIHEMHVARLSGRMPAAERAAQEAVASVDPIAAPRNHAIYVAHLGNSLARVGKYEEAVAVSRQALSSTVRKGSQRVTAELRETARLLAGATYGPARDFATTIDRLLLPAV